MRKTQTHNAHLEVMAWLRSEQGPQPKPRHDPGIFIISRLGASPGCRNASHDCFF